MEAEGIAGQGVMRVPRKVSVSWGDVFIVCARHARQGSTAVEGQALRAQTPASAK